MAKPISDAELDDLFEYRPGSRPWIETLTDEQRAWIEAVAQKVRELGREPTWNRVRDRFGERFGEAHLPKTSTTFRETCKRLIRGQ